MVFPADSPCRQAPHVPTGSQWPATASRNQLRSGNLNQFRASLKGRFSRIYQGAMPGVIPAFSSEGRSPPT
jgi:hypothetical protein